MPWKRIYAPAVNFQETARSKQSEQILQTKGQRRRSLWKNLQCAISGHQLRSSMLNDPLQCVECGRTWGWTDMFQGRIPRGRLHSQRAYDDLESAKELR
jgi:hypothetical protein